MVQQVKLLPLIILKKGLGSNPNFPSFLSHIETYNCFLLTSHLDISSTFDTNSLAKLDCCSFKPSHGLPDSRRMTEISTLTHFHMLKAITDFDHGCNDKN